MNSDALLNMYVLVRETNLQNWYVFNLSAIDPVNDWKMLMNNKWLHLGCMYTPA